MVPFIVFQDDAVFLLWQCKDLCAEIAFALLAPFCLVPVRQLPHDRGWRGIFALLAQSVGGRPDLGVGLVGEFAQP